MTTITSRSNTYHKKSPNGIKTQGFKNKMTFVIIITFFAHSIECVVPLSL